MRRTTRIAVALGVIVAVVGLWSSGASAHVTVSGPYPVTKGGYAKLTFRVPNEREDGSTIKLRVQLPKDKPFTSVSAKPKAGWTYQPVKSPIDPPLKTESGREITESITEVSWTAQGDTKIAPGEFDEFELSVGTLPKDVNELTFPAIQTYSAPDKDGKTDVDWIQKRVAGQADPAKPEPLLKLVDAPAAATGTTVEANTQASQSNLAAQGDSSNVAAVSGAAADARTAADSAKTTGTIALVAALIALIVGIAGLAMKGRRAA